MFEFTPFSFGGDDNKPEETKPEITPEPVVPAPELTDEEVNASFSEMVDNIESDEEVIAAAAAVLAAEQAVAETEARSLEIKAAVDKNKAEIEALERQLTEAKRQKMRLNDEWWPRHQEKLAAIRGFNEAKKTEIQAKDNAKARQQAKMSTNEYLHRAQNFDWFNGLSGRPDLKVLPHQWDGIRFLASAERAILGDKMGVGKTLTSIGALDVIDAKRILIITPSDITTNFVKEIQMWADHRVVVNIRGESKATRNVMMQALDSLESFVLVVNYEAWRKDLSLLVRLGDLGFDTLIMDEAHTAKETSSITYRGLKQIVETNNLCPRCGIIAKAQGLVANTNKCAQCAWNGESVSYEETDSMPWSERYWLTKSLKRIWPMTGTPILNRPGDMFALLSLIDPVQFDNKNEFLRMYAEFDQYKGKWTFRTGGMSSLMTRLSGKFLARSMTDAGITLPPQHPIRHEIDLDPVRYAKQLAVIDQITNHAKIVLSEDKKMKITEIIAIITRQRQANVWPGGIELKDPETGEIMWRVGEDVQESAKIDAAIDLVKEFTAQGERVVIFSQFSSALREINARMNGLENDEGHEIRSVVFDGTTPQDVRETIKTNFDKKRGEVPLWDVVCANYKTGGTGLNLTAATHTIILDREWNPGKEDQALARTLRIGQDKETFVHILTIPNTIDDWLDSIIEHKKQMVDGFEASADELKNDLLKILNG